MMQLPAVMEAVLMLVMKVERRIEQKPRGRLLIVGKDMGAVDPCWPRLTLVQVKQMLVSTSSLLLCVCVEQEA